MRDAIADALRGFPRQVIAPDGRKAAAVGVTLTAEDDGVAFLQTRHAARLRGHAGQWALPGGRAERGETPGETARRELAEELGLHLGPDAELGVLDDYATRSGYVMTPVVLWAGSSRSSPGGDAYAADGSRTAATLSGTVRNDTNRTTSSAARPHTPSATACADRPAERSPYWPIRSW